MVRFAVRVRSILVVVLVLFGATTVGGCSGTAECQKAAPSAAFVGKLTDLHGGNATFTVESWNANPSGRQPQPVPGRVGTSVVVRYPSEQAGFLRVNRRYSVTVWGTNGRYGSGVRMASDGCSGGTAYANGKSIDTSLWSRSVIRRAVLGFIFLVVGGLLLIAWLTRRSHRRRTEA